MLLALSRCAALLTVLVSRTLNDCSVKSKQAVRSTSSLCLRGCCCFYGQEASVQFNLLSLCMPILAGTGR
uniref:Putative secreted peptide n=1 Tax=Anopheles braziliensis TaxID=58242 RepID=A0A2M3ZVX4_9DIPT